MRWLRHRQHKIAYRLYSRRLGLALPSPSSAVLVFFLGEPPGRPRCDSFRLEKRVGDDAYHSREEDGVDPVPV